MIIKYTTKNINQKIYSRGILNYIYEHYHYRDYKRLLKQDKWKILISPVEESDPSFYTADEKTSLSGQIPHGVTGFNEIKVYILDINNPMIMLQNFTAIYHECAHMVLKIYYPHEQVIQRNNDFYSLKGNKRKFFSSEIHDRSAEGKFRQIKVHTGILGRIDNRSINLIGIDITDLTNSRKSFKIE
jgi:hypothetical protein